MIQNNGLTLDLLLGLPKADSVVGQVATTEMRPFSELLAALTPNGVEGVPGSQPLFNSMVQGLGFSNPSTANGTVDHLEAPRLPILAELFASSATGTTGGIGFAPTPRSTVVAKELPSEIEIEGAQVTDPKIAPPFELFGSVGASAESDDSIHARRLLALMNTAGPRVQHQATGLDAGTYQILSATVTGDRLELTLQSDEQNAEPLRVSLPISVLEEIAANAGSSANSAVRTLPVRVALTQANSSDANVAGLLAKLNLKELRVEAPTDPDQISKYDTANTKKNEALTLTLRGESLAQPFKLDVPVLRRTILSHTTPSDRTRPAEGLDLVSTTDSARPVLAGTVLAGAGNGKAAEPTNWPRAFDPFGGSSFDSPESLDFRAVDAGALAALQDDKTVQGERMTVQPVRFTLPDQIAAQLKPNGRSVSIAIEPEHLGKATLRLSVSNHLLSARLTVDSPAAKAMVEQSLDQLMNHLAKAGIKVDLISVNVAGGDANTNLFGHRQSTQFERNRQTRRPADHNFAQTLNTTVDPSRPKLRSYVGPHGVNVFA